LRLGVGFERPICQRLNHEVRRHIDEPKLVDTMNLWRKVLSRTALSTSAPTREQLTLAMFVAIMKYKQHKLRTRDLRVDPEHPPHEEDADETHHWSVRI